MLVIPAFSYRAFDSQGKKYQGTVEAKTSDEAVEELRGKGLYVASVNPMRQSFFNVSFFSFNKVSRRDLALFCRQLNTILLAGIPFLTALETIRKQTANKKLKSVTAEIVNDLEEGESFSLSLKKHPGVFPDLMVSMVEAGEVGGVLDDVLLWLSNHFDREHNLLEKIKNALSYPIVVLGVAFIVLIVLAVFVLPTFARLYEGFAVELPLVTRIVISISEAIVSYWYVFIILVGLIIYGAARFIKQKKGTPGFDRFLLNIPVFGDLLNKLVISRFCRTLSTMLKGGVPIIRALEVAGSTANNSIVLQSVEVAKERIKEGSGMAEPLEASGVFPPLVIQMISTGEETGALSELLDKVSDFYEEELDTRIQALTSLIEPLLLVLLGIIVGVIVVAVILPLFSLLGAL